MFVIRRNDTRTLFHGRVPKSTGDGLRNVWGAEHFYADQLDVNAPMKFATADEARGFAAGALPFIDVTVEPASE